MNYKMNKRLIVVTGGTKGIGKAVLEIFAATSQFDLVTCSRNEDELYNVKKELEGKYNGIQLFIKKVDLSKKEDCDSFVGYIHLLKKDVEVLVNNAGIFFPGSVHNEPDGQLEMMLSTNLISAYQITRGLIEKMKVNKRGHIFNMCSTASIIPYVNGGSYCISKFALYGMTKILREEMKDYGVRVTAILPGATLTASWEGTDLPEERFMKSEDVASAIFNAFNLSPNAVVEEILIRPQLGDI
jgi:short-subunit dehydrogenase